MPYCLTHWGRDKMAAISQTTFSSAFSAHENTWILIKISPNFVPKGSVNNIASMVQIIPWRRPGDKPLSQPMMVSLSTHICVSRLQWVNACFVYWGPGVTQSWWYYPNQRQYCKVKMVINTFDFLWQAHATFNHLSHYWIYLTLQQGANITVQLYG